MLPELAESGLRPAGPAEAHLVACSACSRDLEQYRSTIALLSDLRGQAVEPSVGFLGRVLARMPEGLEEPEVFAFLERGRAAGLRRVVTDERFRRAAISVGGVAVGAAAIGLLWWRSARRTLGGAERALAGSE
jgi:hypothetical protein